MRADKYIWAVRLYKTRALAAKAIVGNRVKVNDDFLKPGKEIKAGDEVSIKVNPVWRRFKVLDIPKSRVGAKLVPDYMKETTSEDVLKEIEHIRLVNRSVNAHEQKGRPTKRDRRNLDDWKDS